jgi:hypothetical protein
VVSIQDLPTGLSYELPVLSAGVPDLLVHGRHVGLSSDDSGGHMNYALWDLDVPREPAALRRWLATISNALPIADSEAVVWPEH